MVIDARGLACPKPVLLAEEALNNMAEGIVEVLVDNEPSADNLAWFAKQNGLYPETIQENGQWRIKIVKGYVCDASSTFKVQGSKHEPKERAAKHLMLVIGTDSFGKEEELGRMLVKGFFETMKVTGEIPHTIFFLNAGVKLTTLNEEIIPVLKELEAMGAEIFSCGTCLKYYDLESALKIGYRGTTNHIVEGMTDFQKVVWI
jgi:selenium metabolism protein YedF